MGLLFSRFRKKKETTEILEELDVEIKKCVNFRLENQESQRRWIGRLYGTGITSYIILALLYYLIYFPDGWVQRIVYSAILVIVPVILILASRRSLMWYYSRKITNNEEKLLVLKEEKEKILEEVMENETYKKAKEILEKFDPDRHKTMTPPRLGANSKPSTPGSELRQRKGGNAVPVPKAPPPPSSAALAIGPPPPPLPGKPSVSLNSAAACPNGVVLRPSTNTPLRMGAPIGGAPVGGTPVRSTRPMLPAGPAGANFPPRGPTPMMGRPPVLPRPVLQADRGVLDRLAEYLVGDGPSNRYALICRRCHRHNGMALKEEFEYLAFHCAYCQFLNPAKRKRPSAPRLPDSNSNPPSRRESDAGSDSDYAGPSPKSKPTTSKTTVSANAVNGGGDATDQSGDDTGGTAASAPTATVARSLAMTPTLAEEVGEQAAVTTEDRTNDDVNGGDDASASGGDDASASGEDEASASGEDNACDRKDGPADGKADDEVVKENEVEAAMDNAGKDGGLSPSASSSSLRGADGGETDDAPVGDDSELSQTNEAMDVDATS